MSRPALEAVLGRTILDEEFRFALFAGPETALVEYELTEDELAALKSVDAENPDACGEEMGRRVIAGLQARTICRDAPSSDIKAERGTIDAIMFEETEA